MSLLDTLGGTTREEDPKEGPGISIKSAVTSPSAAADPTEEDPKAAPAPKPKEKDAEEEEPEPKPKPKPVAAADADPPVKPKAPVSATETDKAKGIGPADPAETGYSASEAYDACTKTDKTKCGEALAEWKIALIVVGCVFVLVLAWFFRRRYKKKADKAKQKAEMTTLAVAGKSMA